MNDQNPDRVERLHQNTFGDHGERIGYPSVSSAWSHLQIRPLASMSHGDLECSVMPVRPSHALHGMSSDLSITTMDCLLPFRSSGSSYCSSSIRAPEQGVLPDITEDYLRLGFVSDDPPTYYPIQESNSPLGSDNFCGAYHLNPSTLNTQETRYDVGDIEQRGRNFYENNLERFLAQKSPYATSSPRSFGFSYSLFDDNEASSSQSNQESCLSSTTGQRYYSHHTSDLNSSLENPFMNTLSRGSGFHRNEIEVMRHNFYLGEEVRKLVMTGPINPMLAMRKQVLPYLLSLLDDGDEVMLENILNGLLHPSSLYRVMKDKHGYHLFNKLLDKCGYIHKWKIVSLVTRANKLLELASDCYGYEIQTSNVFFFC